MTRSKVDALSELCSPFLKEATLHSLYYYQQDMLCRFSLALNRGRNYKSSVHLQEDFPNISA